MDVSLICPRPDLCMESWRERTVYHLAIEALRTRRVIAHTRRVFRNHIIHVWNFLFAGMAVTNGWSKTDQICGISGDDLRRRAPTHGETCTCHHVLLLEGLNLTWAPCLRPSSYTDRGLGDSYSVRLRYGGEFRARISEYSNVVSASWAELYLLRDELGASRAGPILSPSYANNLAQLAAQFDRLT